MQARNLRLIRIFVTNVGWMLLFILGFVTYVTVLYLLPMAWSVALGIMVPLGFFINICWDQAKYRLERQEYAEKMLLDQLSRED